MPGRPLCSGGPARRRRPCRRHHQDHSAAFRDLLSDDRLSARSGGVGCGHRSRRRALRTGARPRDVSGLISEPPPVDGRAGRVPAGLKTPRSLTATTGQERDLRVLGAGPSLLGAARPPPLGQRLSGGSNVWTTSTTERVSCSRGHSPGGARRSPSPAASRRDRRARSRSARCRSVTCCKRSMAVPVSIRVAHHLAIKPKLACKNTRGLWLAPLA